MTILKNSIQLINRLNEFIGKRIAFLVIAMMVIIVYDVTMRYQYSIGSVALQELQWHLFALIFLLGSAYTLKYDEHVRVDVIYQSAWMNDRRRAWVNIFGSFFLLLPFCILIIYTSYPFVYAAFIQNEMSPDPGGLPYRFLLKAAIPVGFGLLALQGLAQGLQNIVFLLENKKDNAS